MPGRPADYQTSAVIFAQGEPCSTVLFIKKGSVKLSVVSHGGKEAVVGLLKSGDFLGEGCLAGQSRRITGVARRNGRHDPVAGELLHEQVSESSGSSITTAVSPSTARS